MKFQENNSQLTIFIENEYEWLEMFDNGAPDTIEIGINPRNYKFFFPKTEDENGDKLPFEEYIYAPTRFKTIRLVVADGVMDKQGEGEFKVTDYLHDVIMPNPKKFAIPGEEDDLILIAFTITPDKLLA